MRAGDKKRIIERYDQRFAEYADDIRTLASGTEERRQLRFDVLAAVGVASGASVLDLGCGFGDFYAYLQRRGLDCDYAGYDINPTLIEVARRKFPGGRFEVRDVQAEEFPQFDFIVSSSAFNLRLTSQDNYAFIEEILRICYGHARRAVAVDLLTSYVDFESPEAFHYRPERVFSIAKGITKRVCLRHDYPLYEFCVYLYPDFQGWRNKGR
ncbi:MAG TPA: class I SAM-dependent methyltransferase [Pyrinomonadaceae bacterium]|jgi:ubiquinone/menaquinone biosynthesis C-methylase UbiE|nr:class I SAM-dependent methyltransferase [Pyrinomonadaceae bacterium]